MEAQEFSSLLLNHLGWQNYDPDTLMWDCTDSALRVTGNTITLPPTLPKTFTVEVVDQNAYHNETNGPLYIVFKVTHFPDNTVQYFKKTGYYQSHEGEYWDGALVEVKPETKTITVWNEPVVELDSYDSYY